MMHLCYRYDNKNAVLATYFLVMDISITTKLSLFVFLMC